MADVVVVGGGPAGLASALLAARAGRSVALLEASDRLGGMAASPVVAGQRVDLGSHRLHPSASPQVRALLDELLGADLQVRPRRGRLRMADRWVAFPLTAPDLLRSLPPATALRIGVDLLTGAARHESPSDTYADVVRARLGPTVLDGFHGPYARKLYGVDPVELSGELARRRIALTGAGDVLAKLRRSATPAGRTFLYPRLGYGQVVERMAEAAVDEGVDIRLGVRPVAVRPDVEDPVVELVGGGRLRTGRVLWTAAPTALLEAVGTPLPAPPHRAVALLYLALDVPRWLTWDAHYVPDPDVPFVRLSEPKNYREGPDPAGRTVLCAEVPCSVGDDVWSAPPGALGEAVLDGIDRLGLPLPAPAEVEVIRLPSVYPAYDDAGLAQARAALASAEAVEGVTVLGRQGLLVADNLHHVIDMAYAAAACLGPDGRWDDEAWAVARRAFDAHVVED